MNKQIWFKAKTYGYGWYPIAWQGWLSIAVYLAALAAWVLYLVPRLSDGADVAVYLIGIFALTTAILYLCYKKGEPARWRWGK